MLLLTNFRGACWIPTLHNIGYSVTCFHACFVLHVRSVVTKPDIKKKTLSDAVPISTSMGSRDLVVVVILGSGSGSVPPVIAGTRLADHIAGINRRANWSLSYLSVFPLKSCIARGASDHNYLGE